MRFVDFLRSTVLLSAGAATTLGVLTLIAATRDQDDQVALYATGWWVVATLIGSWVGRRNEINPPIARLLADAKAATMIPTSGRAPRCSTGCGRCCSSSSWPAR